ncbi:class I SAM-dependent methyltransferase [Stackebrandtia albiflava]|uniref:class I SAM-dependent methyltransferase n=1 Tax=Stackebrandtia albiflava TaxID=406432 RepID=UPI001B86E90C|nr:class I SAM-dependent methyltransferase [Stackebrandtia albiflava]
MSEEMRADYTDVFKDPGAVAKYSEETYATGTFSSRVSERQRQWLRGFVSEAFPEPPVQHDFACGTGRAIRMLAGMVAEAHGYDTSEAMLAKAAELRTPARLHLVGATGELPVDDRRPALVTVFRLLLNASPSVRDRAMDFAAGMLPDADAGLLVCENHGNAGSIRHLKAVFGRPDSKRWFAELSHADVMELFARHGFELVARQGFTMLTQGFYSRAPLSWLAPPLDDLASRRRWSAAAASDVLYVARRRR